MAGNVAELTQNCWDRDCGYRAVRGTSWFGTAEGGFRRVRGRIRSGRRIYDHGFRVSRTLE
jgi:formylglycine-generating enzyme required for sulfatase activity